eukprot:364792-Chlamydomonas_euryale.AAC.12
MTSPRCPRCLRVSRAAWGWARAAWGWAPSRRRDGAVARGRRGRHVPMDKLAFKGLPASARRSIRGRGRPCLAWWPLTRTRAHACSARRTDIGADAEYSSCCSNACACGALRNTIGAAAVTI